MTAATEDPEEQLQCKEGAIRKQPSTEVSTSGDELIRDELITTKVRKPYTITKQRERWTEEEHHKFLEALKLYGRAWRKIEEHIGTKTAVQIRSHAQKFFSKVEREQASAISTGKSPEIDIPPPRPKRKPTYPYPRKAGGTPSPSDVTNVPPQVVIPSAAAISRPPLVDAAAKAKTGGFVPYSTPGGRNDVSNTQPELKLFGHTVVFPTEGRDRDAENPEIVEANSVTLEALKRTNSSSGSGMESEHSLSPNSYPPCNDQLRALGYYPGVTEAAPLAAFLPWQVPPPPTWPSGAVNEVLRSMFLGMPPEIYASTEASMDASAALAAATIAAASAWWSLQGSMPPTFLAQPTMIRKEQFESLEPEASNMKKVDDRPSSGAREERRVRSRSVSGSNDPEEDNSPSPGSDCGAGSNESLIVDDQTFKSSGCSNAGQGGSSSDKEKAGEDGCTLEEELRFSGQSSNRIKPQVSHGRGSFKSSSRCSGSSDGEQRKEVSQEGRMAFQALFSHQKLPQTFYARAKQKDGLESLKNEPEQVSSCSRLSTLSDSWSNRRSSRSGFVPYKRASEEQVLPLTKNSHQQQQQAVQNCGLENHVLDTWCVLDEEVVKQS